MPKETSARRALKDQREEMENTGETVHVLHTLFLWLYVVVVGIKPRALCMLGKSSATELPSPALGLLVLYCYCFVFEIRSVWTKLASNSRETGLLLPLPPESWD